MDQFAQQNDEPPSISSGATSGEWQQSERVPRCLPRHEKIRIAFLCVSLLVVIASFILFVAAGTVLPLFGSIIVAYLLYRGIDRYLSKTESP